MNGGMAPALAGDLAKPDEVVRVAMDSCVALVVLPHSRPVRRRAPQTTSVPSATLSATAEASGCTPCCDGGALRHDPAVAATANFGVPSGCAGSAAFTETDRRMAEC